MVNSNYMNEENLLIRTLLHPERKLNLKEASEIEDNLLELAIKLNSNELPIDYEPWKNKTQYPRIIHAYEKKSPHIVLKGTNPFDFPIIKRAGNGDLEIVHPGEKFKSHALVYLN